MDYTDSPRTNAQPDESNFEFLKELYGVVGGTLAPATPPQQQQGGGMYDGANNGSTVGWGGRYLRRVEEDVPSTDDDEDDEEESMESEESVSSDEKQDAPEEVVRSFHTELSALSLSGAEESGWKYVGSDNAGVSYAKQLTSEYFIRVFLLKA